AATRTDTVRLSKISIHLSKSLHPNVPPTTFRTRIPHRPAPMNLERDGTLTSQEFLDLFLVVVGLRRGRAVEVREVQTIEPGGDSWILADAADAQGVPFPDLPGFQPVLGGGGVEEIVGFPGHRAFVGFSGKALHGAFVIQLSKDVERADDHALLAAGGL